MEQADRQMDGPIAALLIVPRLLLHALMVVRTVQWTSRRPVLRRLCRLSELVPTLLVSGYSSSSAQLTSFDVRASTES